MLQSIQKETRFIMWAKLPANRGEAGWVQWMVEENEDFFARLQLIVNLFGPIVDLMKMTDKDVATMGKV